MNENENEKENEREKGKGNEKGTDKEKVKLRIGVVPVKRGFLSMEEALRQKRLFMQTIAAIRPGDVLLVDIDDCCENGILHNTAHVDGVIDKMCEHKVDALFVPFCDFGEEVVAARVTAALSLPVLVWGARDERPNTEASRGRDTQCGMFAATKVMARLGVTYSYLYNVPSDSDEFREGFETFLRTVNVVKCLKGLRVAQVGQRPGSFMSVIAGEATLLEQFGIEVVPLGVGAVMQRMDNVKKEQAAEVTAYGAKLRAKIDTSRVTADQIDTMAAFAIALRDALSALGCRGAALECWSALPVFLGFTPCFVAGELTDMGYPVSCETDVNGVITSIMLEAAAMGDSVSFFADLTIRHPENDNAELLWHCGPFPYSLRDPQAPAFIAANGQGRFPLKKGDLTIARFDDLNGQYSLVAVEGHTVPGPETTGTYTYFETDDWKRVEEKFIFGPYIHHVAGCYGQYARCLQEATRFIKALSWDAPGTGPTAL